MILFRLGLFALAACCAAGGALAAGMPRYEHIFVIVAENKGFDQIVGSPDAPRLNAFAKEYGLATRFYGEVHPSEGNYVAMLGGSTFGIHDDDAWYCDSMTMKLHCKHSVMPEYASHSITARSLMDQIEAAKLTWKGYFEDIPAAGSLEIESEGKGDLPSGLYAAKHNAFINFERVREDPELAKKVVPLGQLAADLAADAAPNYAQVILNQCNDMHGLWEPGPVKDCAVKWHAPEVMGALIRRGDAAIAAQVDRIMAAPLWGKPGNAAIVITWDEDNGDTKGAQGCCGFEPGSTANFGGGHIATIVITNHGPRHVEDGEAYNHYSLLRTTEEAFGIGEHIGLAGAADKGVKAMTPLFAAPGK
jgi:phosphatidylinositol-3-phosphatase